MGEAPGLNKLEKIKSMKLKTLDEDGFYDLVNKYGPKVDVTDLNSTELSASVKFTPSKAVYSLSTTLPPSHSSTPQPSTSNPIHPFAVREPDKIYERPNIKSAPNAGLLWTDKYKPTSYKEVIGNKTNIDKLVLFLNNWYIDQLIQDKK